MLYLVRHGKAEDGPVDVQRRLADKGRKAMQRVAERLEAAGIRPASHRRPGPAA